MGESKRSGGKPLEPPNEGAAELAQQLLSQIQHDFVAVPAAEKVKATETANAMLGQLQSFVNHEQQKKQAATQLANALLNKVAHDFGSTPPPAMHASADAYVVQSDAELEAAASGGRLSEQELAELDAMTAPTGFWGKLVARLRGKKVAGT